MRAPIRARQRGLQFNITPLIDIVFLLIIFFLVASHLARSETSQPVDLPEASLQTAEQQQLPHRIIVTITPNERYHVAGNQIEFMDVEQLILHTKQDAGDQEIEVQIRCDRRVAYQIVEPLLLACVRAGVTKVKFAVLPTR